MTKIDRRYYHLANAAQGWLDLGLANEAECELNRIPSDLRKSPPLMDLHWRVYAAKEAWSQAEQLAASEIAIDGSRVSPWLRLAYSIRRARPKPTGTEAASETLKEVAQRFPNEPVVAYNLACYACQLGKRDEAIEWLKRAIQRGDRTTILTMAAADDDLQPMWPILGDL